MELAIIFLLKIIFFSPAVQEKMEVLLTHCIAGGKVSNMQIFGEQLTWWLNHLVEQEQPRL